MTTLQRRATATLSCRDRDAVRGRLSAPLCACAWGPSAPRRCRGSSRRSAARATRHTASPSVTWTGVSGARHTRQSTQAYTQTHTTPQVMSIGCDGVCCACSPCTLGIWSPRTLPSTPTPTYTPRTAHAHSRTFPPTHIRTHTRARRHTHTTHTLLLPCCPSMVSSPLLTPAASHPGRRRRMGAGDAPPRRLARARPLSYVRQAHTRHHIYTAAAAPPELLPPSEAASSPIGHYLLNKGIAATPAAGGTGGSPARAAASVWRLHKIV
jgi:hypothetical protein